MHLRLTPPIILVLWALWLFTAVDSVSVHLPATDEIEPMVPWKWPTGRPGTSSATNTWTAESTRKGPMTLAMLYKVANAHFNSVKLLPYAQSQRGSLLVAALWVPSEEAVFASTIPRGDYLEHMKNNIESNKCSAPVWRSHAKDFIPDHFHAEDGAYFLFEESRRPYADLDGLDKEKINRALNTKYPPGTMLAVWGYHSRDTEDTKRTGRPIDLCNAINTSDLRSPSCEQLANYLGITFEKVTDEPFQGQTVDEEDLSGGVDDDDFSALCEAVEQKRWIPGQPVKHARQESSCSSTITMSLTYAPTPLTIDLDEPSSPTTTTTSPTTSDQQQQSTITAAPALSCQLHNQDPDQGILKAFCLCNDSITLSPLPATKAQSESCAYSTMPGASATEVVPTQTQIWTANCQACTIVGGIADAETCTPVAGCAPTATAAPTIAAWVSNLTTIDIGDAEDGNNGTDLANEMFKKLKAMCDSGTCKSDPAVMDNVEAILAKGEEPLKPAMVLQSVAFDTSKPEILDQMLSVGIGAWIGVLNSKDLGLCKDVEYEADADETGSGCGKGPISPSRLRRKVRRDDGAVLWERGGLKREEAALRERCLDNCDRPRVCRYTARMCNAPTEITVVMAGAGDPYANHLNIAVQLELTPGGGFLCELIMGALTEFVIFLAPELAGPDVMGDVELEAICGYIEDPVGFLGNLTHTLKVPSRAELSGRPRLLELEASG